MAGVRGEPPRLKVGLTAALLALGAMLAACGGSLEDDYRNGKVPGQKPTATTRNPNGALGRAGAGATMAKVPIPAAMPSSGGSALR